MRDQEEGGGDQRQPQLWLKKTTQKSQVEGNLKRSQNFNSHSSESEESQWDQEYFKQKPRNGKDICLSVHVEILGDV